MEHFLLLILTSCTPSTTNHKTILSPTPPDSPLTNTTPLPEPDSTPFKINHEFPWLPDTIHAYIHRSTNKMVQSFIKDSSISFIYYNIEKPTIDIHIGADLYTGERILFTTVEVISINTITRKIISK